MSNRKISIIIPVYNHAKALAPCLQSIKNQTVGVGGLEIIIVNDGSTDITQPELEAKVQLFNFSTIQLIYQSNQGAPVARNNGFKQSTSQYILFCDADVVMKPDMLEKMVKVLDENPNVSYVYSAFKFGRKKFRLWEFDVEKLKQMPYIHTTSLIRREHFPGFDPSLKRLQDWDLWLTMLEQGHVGKWITEVLFKVTSGGTMSKWLPSFVVNFKFGKKAKQYQESVQTVKQKHKLT